MAQELNIPVSKDGIWTSGKKDPTLWWSKFGDFVREYYQISKKIPPCGDNTRGEPLADGDYNYWLEDYNRTGKPIVRRQLISDYNETKERKEQNYNYAKYVNGQQVTTSGGWNRNNNKFSSYDSSKWVDFKAVTAEEVPALLSIGYSMVNKSDMSKSAMYDPGVGKIIFFMVKREWNSQ